MNEARRSVAHGKTRAELRALLIEQGGGCAICRCTSAAGRGWYADHDPRTGEFRGVLCPRCNAGLVFFRDDPRLLYAAIHYLEAHHRRTHGENGKRFKIKGAAPRATVDAPNNHTA